MKISDDMCFKHPMLPEGIEPPSQEPESYVLSITPREQDNSIILHEWSEKNKSAILTSAFLICLLDRRLGYQRFRNFINFSESVIDA